MAAVPELVEVRGEVFFPVADFERINDEQLALGRSPFANPRNTAAGHPSPADRPPRGGAGHGVGRRWRRASAGGVAAAALARAEARVARLAAEVERVRGEHGSARG